jgi:raffinose/stachyose/melibiose transport system substrate-binding protein
MDLLNNNQTTFAQSATAKLLLDQMKDMVDNGYWGTNYMDNAFSDAAANFVSGEYAMVVANQGFPEEVNTLDPSFSRDDVGFFVIPLADNQILNINPVVPTRFVYSGSPNIDAAKQYLAYTARPDNLQFLVDNVPKFNSLPISGANDKYAGTVKEFYDTYTEFGTVYQTAVKYVNPQWTEMGKEIVNVILGQNDSTVMLENIDKNRASQAEAAKDPAWG